MSMLDPRETNHLLLHASRVFPDANIAVTRVHLEIIHIDVDRHRYTFEIGSDDDEYLFTDGNVSFSIPLMEIE